MNALAALIEMLLEMHRQGTIDDWEAVREAVESGTFKEDLFPPEHDFWKAFLEYMSRDYFTRLWTYQEIVLATRTGVLCARGGFEYRLIEDCRNTLFKLNMGGPVWNRDLLWSWGQSSRDIDRLAEMLVRSPPKTLLNAPQSFPRFLLETRHLRATMVKDHIYGMLALVDEATRSRILIDYDATDAEAFANAVKVSLRTSGNLVVLPALWEAYERVPQAVSNLPSWCPDFSNADNSIPRIPSTRFGESSIGEETKNKSLEFALCDLGGPWNSLGVTGMGIDVVKKGVQHKVTLETWEYGKIVQSGNIRAAFKELIETYSRPPVWDWLQALKATLPWTDGDDSSSHGDRTIEMLLPSQVGPRSHNDGEPRRLLNLAYRFCELLHTGHREELLGDIETLAEPIVKTFLLLVLQNGKYIFETTAGKLGFSYSQVRPDDRIVLICGASQLHVISTDGKRSVGTVYIDAYADESLLEVAGNPDGKWEMFYLY
jgi:hypothetical protein